jgi:hypothetical protein
MGAFSRRALFASGAGLALIGSAAAVPSLAKGIGNDDTLCPDAELIRLCAQCDALQVKIDALWQGDPTRGMSLADARTFEAARDLDQQPFHDAQDPLLERICDLRASTPQGHAARARTLIGWDKDPCWVDDGCWNSQMLGAIVRDLVGEA